MGNLTNCKDCGHSVSKRANTCPHCGVRNPGNTTSMLTQLLVFGLVLWVGTPIIIERLETDTGNSGGDSNQQRSSISRESSARIIAKREVTKKLIAPSTADFSGYADTQIGLLYGRGEDVWIVKGYVDAQNTFGAMIRSTYEVVIVFEEGTSDSYKVESADLWEP